MSQAAYFIIDVKITAPEGMKPYQAGVEDTLRAFGGERIVAGGAIEVLEGEAPRGRIIIVRFPSLAQAHAWHDSAAYQAIIGHRLAASESHAFFVEGVA
jgi:uncharacterized protein (DUF1330 family)